MHLHRAMCYVFWLESFSLTYAVKRTQSCDVIVRLMTEDRIVLIDRILEDYHTCLKCVDSNDTINPATQWAVLINGAPLADESAVMNLNGTLILLNSAVVVPGNGRDVDVVANCYTEDQSLNRNITLYSESMLQQLHEGGQIANLCRGISPVR